MKQLFRSKKKTEDIEYYKNRLRDVRSEMWQIEKDCKNKRFVNYKIQNRYYELQSELTSIKQTLKELKVTL